MVEEIRHEWMGCTLMEGEEEEVDDDDVRLQVVARGG